MLTVLTIVTMIIISWVSSLPLEPDFITPIWIWLAPHGLQSATVKQWGYSTVGSGAWALKFNGVYTAVVVGAPGFPAREFCGFTFDYTLTGWSFTAGYNSPVSYIRPTTTAISLGYWTVGILYGRCRSHLHWRNHAGILFQMFFCCINRHTTSRIYYLAGNYSDCLEH